MLQAGANPAGSREPELLAQDTLGSMLPPVRIAQRQAQAQGLSSGPPQADLVVVVHV